MAYTPEQVAQALAKAVARIEVLEARAAAADKLVRAIEVTMIAGDITKPMLSAMIAYDATKEGE